MKKYSFLFLFALVFNCTTSEKATRFNGMPTAEAKPDHYLRTTSYGLNALVFIPIRRNAEFPEALESFSDIARKNKGSKFRIIQKETSKWFLILPPFSFIVTPVITEIVGEVYE
jgi:hypothetical protein